MNLVLPGCLLTTHLVLTPFRRRDTRQVHTYLGLLSQTFSKFSLYRDAPDEVPIRRRGTSSPGKHVCQSLLSPRQAAIIEYHILGVDHLGG